MSWPIPLAPGATLDPLSGAIRMPASSPAVAMATAQLLLWQLGRLPAGLVAAYTWPGQDVASWTGGCAHRRHPNADQLLVVAVAEGSPTQSGTLTFTPSSGSAVTIISTVLADGDDMWDDTGGWTVAAVPVPLDDSGIQIHSFTASSLYLHALTVMEMPRASLTASGDEAVDLRAGGYAGLEVGRMITDSSTAGVPALLGATRDARDFSVRHLNLSWPSSHAWAVNDASPSWGNLADKGLSTSGGYLPHISRRIRDAEGSREYTVYAHIRTTAAGASVRVRSGTTADTAVCSTTSGTAAWVVASSTLYVDCDADDSLYVEGTITSGAGEVYIDGLGLVEV